MTAARMPQAATQPEPEKDLTPVLPAELEFYRAYDWCLEPHQRVQDVVGYIRSEIEQYPRLEQKWQIAEVTTNVFLLSCAVLNAAEEYLRGPTLRLPRQLAARRVGRTARLVTENLAANELRGQRRFVRRWKQGLQAALEEFLFVAIDGEKADASRLAKGGERLGSLLRTKLPPPLQEERIGIPTPFRRLDLTHYDILALGARFVSRFPDRSQPLLLLGLRTSGSYFAPLLRTFLKTQGYRHVSSVTVQPDKGPGRWERKQLARHAQQGCTALLLDDPPYSGGTVALGLDIARRAGFPKDKVVVLLPGQSSRRTAGQFVAHVTIMLEPGDWYKQRMLSPQAVERRLAEYFAHREGDGIRLSATRPAAEFNALLRDSQPAHRGTRLKCIYEVVLQTRQGQERTCYVLAKSVGWGWLGYHAFLAGHSLTNFVPPILGLRDGILYMEWLPCPSSAQGQTIAREELIDTAARYTARRMRYLGMRPGPAPGKSLRRHENGLSLLEKALSKAYGLFGRDTLMRPHLSHRLSRLRCPVPALIDGNMAAAEWVLGADGMLKTDYEHHGMGKAELNIADPAYDLADTILGFALSAEEEDRLLQAYIKDSGDCGVNQRLFIHKLLAGLWNMDQARERLFSQPHTLDTQRKLHRRFMNAWNFLTVQTARFCGSQLPAPRDLAWRAPIVVLDVDGVLDRRLFGFPCTTAAGMEALSLLRAHGFCIALNTARSVSEVKDYCQAYSLAGGIGEHGSYLWDAVAQRERVLISAGAMHQLEKLRARLQTLPGVFLDDRHQYSIRAFTYSGKEGGLLTSLLSAALSPKEATCPLPTLMIQQLMADLRLDQLSFHHTTIDTTIVAKEIDKGTGLSALRGCVLEPHAETYAIGDSSADLAMFQAATRSFAPSHIDCAHQARLLGCQIARRPFQRGFLEITRTFVRAGSRRCQQFGERGHSLNAADDLFLELLRAADRPWSVALTSILSLPGALSGFVR